MKNGLVPNIERFPPEFMFQLNDDEKNELVANCDRFKNLNNENIEEIFRQLDYLNELHKPDRIGFR